MSPEDPPQDQPGKTPVPPPQKKGLLERNIPMKWILALIILYMVIYNLILFWNTRGR
jgi:hypothetical protein